MDSTKIIENFKGSSEWIAIGHSDGFRPERLEEPLTVERFEQEHLAQKQCLGFYLMDTESRVQCSCIDFDDHGEDAEWRAKAETYYFPLVRVGPVPGDGGFQQR